MQVATYFPKKIQSNSYFYTHLFSFMSIVDQGKSDAILVLRIGICGPKTDN